MTNTITTGHLSPLWTDAFKQFSYEKQSVTQAEIDEWAKLGYDQANVKSFTGHMYDNRNPMPEWIPKIEDAFGLYKQTYTFYKMQTLEIMPVHADHYRTYCRINGVTYDQVYRTLLMLEDWKPGHYLEIDGVAYTNWHAGDWFKWKGATPHAASNIGIEDRYTLQVTGISISSGQLSTLLQINIPDDKSDTIIHPLVRQRIKPNVEQYSMVYMNNGYIDELDSITHSEEVVALLNKEGLHIYLWEPLCSYIPGQEFTQEYYSEFTEDDSTNLNIRSAELDSIVNYGLRNALYNITVHSCDFNISKYYHYDLKLKCNDLFLKTHPNGNIKKLKSSINSEFSKKFICLNWRYTPHRETISNFLADKDGHLSWYFDIAVGTHRFDQYKSYHEIYDQLQHGSTKINKHGPYYVDIKTDTFAKGIWPTAGGFKSGDTPALFNGEHNLLESYYNDSFVDIVNETRFAQPTANFSEKVFQAVQYMKPFILVAPPETLHYVKTFGFKTFSDFWDESYDDEHDHTIRMVKILKLIDNIIEMPIEELHQMYKKMSTILEHNLEVYNRMII